MSRKKSELKVILLAGLSFLLMTSAGFAQMTDAAAGPSQASGMIAQNRSPSGGPSQGQTAKYQYLYYPAASVYFDTARELYFFRMDGRWIKSPTLPAQMRRQLGEFVVVGMDTAEPYELHSEVARSYPATGRIKQEETPVPPSRSPQVSRTIVPFRQDTASTQTQALPERRDPGVPPWAPAGGQTGYQYHYYPDSFVYRDLGRNVYYYRQNSEWIESATLPAYISENMGSPVLLNMNTDRPYQYHSEVIQRYPHPGYHENVQKFIRIERETIIRD